MSLLLTGAQDAVDAVRGALQQYLPAVLAAYEERTGLTLPMPQTVDLLATLEAMSSAAVPALAVSEGGLAEPLTPGASGQRGVYDGAFRVTARVLSRGQDYEDTSRISRVYGDAVIRAVMWHRRLGGLATTVAVTAAEPGVIDPAAVRTLAAREIDFTVYLPDVLDVSQDAPFTPDGPEVTSYDVTVTRKD
jgi:hypothetical protein